MRYTSPYYTDPLAPPDLPPELQPPTPPQRAAPPIPGDRWRSVPGEAGGGYYQPPPLPVGQPAVGEPSVGQPSAGVPTSLPRFETDAPWSQGGDPARGLAWARYTPPEPAPSWWGAPDQYLAPPYGGLRRGPNGVPLTPEVMASPRLPWMPPGMPAWKGMTQPQLQSVDFGPAGNILMGPESGGRNISGPMTSSGRARGPLQITDGTWQEFAPRAGVDTTRWSNAQVAPPQVQRAVAEQIPLRRWETADAVLRAYPWANRDMTLGQINRMAGGGAPAYIPASYTPRGGIPRFTPDRPSSMWGRDPEMQYSPGIVPMPRDIPNVMAGLLPIVLALFSSHAGFAGTAMLTAFGAYQGARNQRNLLDAKNQHKLWQDNLAETKARLQEEQLEAAGAMALPPGQEQMSRLHEIALRYGDQQLLAAVESGDPKAAERLFQARDKAYQDVSKTHFSLEKEQLQIAKMQLDLEIEKLKLQEREAKGPAEQAKAKAAREAAERKRRRLEQQERDYPGSTGGEAEAAPDEGAPAEERPAPEAAPGETPQTPEEEPDTTEPAAPSAAPAPTAPARPPAPAPGEGPSRWGPEGPPPGYVDPDAPARPVAPVARPAPARPARPEQRAEAPPEYGLYQLTADDQPPTPPQAERRPGVSAGVPRPPTQGEVEARESGTYRLARSMLHGDEPPPGMGAGINQDAETVRTGLQAKLRALTNTGLSGKELVDAVRRVDNQTANDLQEVMENRSPLQTQGSGGGGGGGVRLSNYRQMLQSLAFRGAPPGSRGPDDPGWLPDQWQHIQNFKNDNGRVQQSLSRANTMGESTALIMKDLAELQAMGIKPDAISRALAEFNNNKVVGNAIFTNLAADLQTFTQEDQFLRAGVASVTETERGIQNVFTPIIPGTPEQIRDYVKHQLMSAATRVKGYEHQWSQLHAPGTMYGQQPFAQSIMDAIPYVDAKTGQYNLPEGMTLPQALQEGVPQPATPTTGWGKAQPQ